MKGNNGIYFNDMDNLMAISWKEIYPSSCTVDDDMKNIYYSSHKDVHVISVDNPDKDDIVISHDYPICTILYFNNFIISACYAVIKVHEVKGR